ncbi:MAG TPA: hypothetical protein VIK27_02670 [Candidatus Aquilonibacter sp.]
MPQTSFHDAATELAARIKGSRIEPVDKDEASRPPSDRPPGFAEALMPGQPISVDGRAHLEPADWDLIEAALEHYAACGTQ